MQQQYNYPYQEPVLEYVGVGTRFLAHLIDAIIIGIFGWIILSIIHWDLFTVLNLSSFVSVTGDAASRLAHTSPAVTLERIITFCIPFVYYIILEAKLGATFGKMALRIRVVKSDGSPIRWGDSIIRNLLRIIDYIPGCYLLGAILIWASPTKQRLGDRAAHTVVIHKDRR